MLAMPPILSAMRVRVRMAEQQVVDVRHQRRALPAGGDIARAEVRDHRHAGALRDHGRLADLQGVRRRPRDRWSGRGSRSAPPGRSGARRAARRGRTVRPSWKFSREIAAVVRGGVGDGQNRRGALARGRAWTGIRWCRTRRPADFDDGDIDAIERRAAHHAGDSHRRLSSFCNSASRRSASMGRSSSRLQAADALGDAVTHRLEELDLHRARSLRISASSSVTTCSVRSCSFSTSLRALDHAAAAGRPGAPLRCRSCGRRLPGSTLRRKMMRSPASFTETLRLRTPSSCSASSVSSW